MVLKGTWDGVGPCECSFSPLSVTAESEPQLYTVLMLLKEIMPDRSRK